MRGSAALATAPLDAAPPAEALEPGDMRRLPFADEMLGAVRVRGSFAPIPLDAFDRACEALRAEEQAAYLHLLRLSVGEGRNWCRIRKRELMERLRLSERRLLRVLDALVARRFARPLQRDNRGTLWRVYLPREAFGERLGDDVLVGRASGLRIVRERAGSTPAPRHERPAFPPAQHERPAFSPAASPNTSGRHYAGREPAATPTTMPVTSTTATETTPPSGADQASTPTPHRRRTPPAGAAAALARSLAAARGRTDPEGLAEAAREVSELIAEGQHADRIAAAIETVRRRARERREDA